MNKRDIKTIGITLGDPAGIGPEIIARALARPAVRKLGSFTIIGPKKICTAYKIKPNTFCSIIDSDIQTLDCEYVAGRPDRKSAQTALRALHMAVTLLKRGTITSLVTAPVCKETLTQVDPKFQGHTEFLASAFAVRNIGMMFLAGKLRALIVTRHIPLAEVSSAINASNIYDSIHLTHLSLKKIFRISKPLIAVCGLNPHAGEGGTIGEEEQTKIIPAVKRAKRKNIQVHGPLAADTLFCPQTLSRFDAVIAMYHDQGLIPVKALYFKKLVNLTLGLPFIRTSPAHGTAFDIAGKRKADPSSMCEAIHLAANLTR